MSSRRRLRVHPLEFRRATHSRYITEEDELAQPPENVAVDSDGSAIYAYSAEVTWCAAGEGVVLAPSTLDHQSATIPTGGLLHKTSTYLLNELGMSSRADYSGAVEVVDGDTCRFSGVRFIATVDLSKPIVPARVTDTGPVSPGIEELRAHRSSTPRSDRAAMPVRAENSTQTLKQRVRTCGEHP